MTARNLNAEIHDIAQGGAALLDKTGWFAGPDFVGMESIYEKIHYDPEPAQPSKWDFQQYRPHVVIVAIGQNDANPENYMAEDYDGEYSNSYYSYAWMTARNLNAEIHDIAQGGAALLDGTGWFDGPDFMGMESIYDKIQYYPKPEKPSKWDFQQYRPHVVIVAIGQNDANPDNYMAENYEGEKAKHWRNSYRDFVAKLRTIYPKATIILATTILGHDANWDKAIDEVCHELADERIHHFLYSNNGTGTPGHIRIPEAEQMSKELTAFIESLGEGIWE